MTPALGTTICEAAVVSKPVALPLIATVPFMVKMPAVPTAHVLPKVIVKVFPVATLLVVLVMAAAVKLVPVATVPPPNVKLLLHTSLVVKMVLPAAAVPVKIIVPAPEPPTVKEAKLLLAGMEDGIADIVKVLAELLFKTTSSPATGAPAGDQTIEPQATLAETVAVFVTAQLSLNESSTITPTKTKIRNPLSAVPKPEQATVVDFFIS